MFTIRKSLPVILVSLLSIGAANAGEQDKPATGADATFKSLDRDADQRLSKAEVTTDKMLTEHFAAVDTNRDGYLSMQEYTAHMKEMKSPKKNY